MERSLALICGGGPLPARMAREARRQGWRVLAFTFAEAPGIDGAAHLTVPSRLTELSPVLETLAREGVSAALFSGKFWLGDVLAVDAAAGDDTVRRLERQLDARTETRLAEAVLGTLSGLGIDVLDQRGFVGDWLAVEGALSRRTATAEERQEIERGLALARVLADHGIGQTVVMKNGVVTAAEAVEGTTEAIRRGLSLSGPGAVVVKAVNREHDYRFDLPTVGPETIETLAAGGAAVLAFEADGVLFVEREEAIRRADAASVAVVGVSAARAPRP